MLVAWGGSGYMYWFYNQQCSGYFWGSLWVGADVASVGAWCMQVPERATPATRHQNSAPSTGGHHAPPKTEMMMPRNPIRKEKTHENSISDDVQVLFN